MGHEHMPIVTAMSTLATVTVTSFENGIMTGDIYNAHYDKTVHFFDSLELLEGLESLFETLSFPGRFENFRRFSNETEKQLHKSTRRGRIDMSEKAKEDKATFVIQVQFRRNATWQGTIQWVDQNKRQSFRSTLEMIRLIDEALEDGNEEPKIEWE